MIWLDGQKTLSLKPNKRTQRLASSIFFFMRPLLFYWADILRIKTYALNTTGPLELLAFAWMEIEKDFLDQERTWSN